MDNKRYFYMSDIDCTITVEYATRKEMLELIDNYVENCKTRDEMIANNNHNAYLYDMSQETFTILYKDGTVEYIDEEFDGHHIKRQHIESIVNENSSTVMVYGHFGLNECGVAEPTFNDEIDESLKEVNTEDYTETTDSTKDTESDTTDTNNDTDSTNETSTDNTITKLEKLFDTAEKYKNSYTWNKDNGNTQQREYKEKQDSIDEFEWYENGDKYTAEYTVQISRYNVYAYGTYTKNGKKTNLTALKNSYKRLLQAVQRE